MECRFHEDMHMESCRHGSSREVLAMTDGGNHFAQRRVVREDEQGHCTDDKICPAKGIKFSDLFTTRHARISRS